MRFLFARLIRSCRVLHLTPIFRVIEIALFLVGGNFNSLSDVCHNLKPTVCSGDTHTKSDGRLLSEKVFS